MRTMYDSVNASVLPADAQMVAGYIDGKYAWKQSDWDRFPNSVKVRIAVFPWTNDGDVLDCEPGDATPAECPDWIKKRQAAGLARPTIYCSLAAMPEVQAACHGLDYDLWIAHWTGIPHLVDGSVATQYAARGTYDLSWANDTWMVTDAPSADPLIGALAYVCDTLGDQVKTLGNQLVDMNAEMARVREQFLGPRP